MRLYDWNISIGAALFEDLSRLEVVMRNVLGKALQSLAATAGWPVPWYQHHSIYTAPARRALDDARGRASEGDRPVNHDRVISELSFGFWRFLCLRRYVSTLWVPALASAFVHHQHPRDPARVRREVAQRMEALHLLRNRIAHHQPIYRRDLRSDAEATRDLLGWVCPVTLRWHDRCSRALAVLDQRPEQDHRRSGPEAADEGDS